MLSEQIEEYLEAIGRLEERGDRITTSSLAKERHVSAPSVTEMLGRLAERGLVSYKPRGDIALTEEGRIQARKVMRRHRLWERFLHDVLGFRWDRVHNEACKLEHATSPEMEQTLARAVGVSTTCPHGYEIPGPEGEIIPKSTISLLEMAPSHPARVVNVREDDPELLREMEKLGIKPGAIVELSELKPDNCDTIITVDGENRTLPVEVAGSINVAPDTLTEADEAIPLAQLKPGETGTVYRYTAGRSLMCRCLALGFTPGTPITMVQNAKSGPLIVSIRDTRVALGRGESQKILILRTSFSDGPQNGNN
ncbi:MAG: FeoA domain-containing protein [Chloroflexota bacterium]